MKRANQSTKLTESPKHEKPSAPSPQTGTNPRDARDDESQLPQNRDELGVGENHKTDDMQEGGRGTFP